MEHFFAQLRERQIFKVATIYVVSAWPLIQIADIAVPTLGLPETVLPLLFKVFLIGFPLCLVFAWILNFTAEGLVRTNQDKANKEKPTSSYKANIRAFATVGGALVLAFLLTLGSQLFFGVPETPTNTATQQTADADTAGLPDRKSIAVLPFDVLSKDAEDEFFIDGMVEELLNVLARIPELQVAARTSSFSYKGVSNKTIVEIGKELGVETILEGSIRKNDVENRIRVTAQLIEVKTGAHIWSETYDREYLDIFQIQDEIAKSVADKLKTTLLGQPEATSFAVGTKDVDAMVEYGKGQKELSHRTATSIEKALQHFQTAASIDSNYGSAYVGISDSNILLALYGSVPKESALTTAQDALNKAFEIDSNLGSAHASQGLLFSTQNRNNEAEASFERAIELSPSYAMAYMWYGSLLQERGEIEKAQRLFIKAFEIDPKSPVAAFNVAWGHYMLGAETEAMDWFSKIVANDPYYPGAYILVGNILRNRGHLDEAIDMYQRVLDIDALNKNAIISLLTTTMDIQAFEQTQLWFTYLDDNPSILSNFERQMIRIRFMATQGKLEEAVKIFEQIEFTPSEEIQRLIITAEIAFYQQDYAAAAETYERLRENFKDNKSAFFFLSEGITAAHLAYCYEQSGQQRKADTLLVDYDRYLQNDRNKKANNPSYYYNMSLLYALRDADEEAFNYLQGAIDAGWVQVWEAKIEPIFSNLASKPRFNQMMGGVNARLAYMRNRLENPRAEVVADG